MKVLKTTQWLIFLLLPMGMIAQNNTDPFKYPTKLFSLKHARLLIGINADIGVSEQTIDESTVYTPKPTYSHPANGQFGMHFDLFAPNSVLGFRSGIAFQSNSFLLSTTRRADTFRLSYFSIPLFLKIRPGNHLKRTHFLMMIGGSLSIPTSASMENSVRLQRFDKGYLTTRFTPEVTLGVEVNLGKNAVDIQTYERNLGERLLNQIEIPRFYLYVKSSYNITPTFKDGMTWYGFNLEQDVNKNSFVSIGMTLFFGLKFFSEKTM